MKRPNTIKIEVNENMLPHELRALSGLCVEGEGECPECGNDVLEIISNTHYECTVCGYTDLQENFS